MESRHSKTPSTPSRVSISIDIEAQEAIPVVPQESAPTEDKGIKYKDNEETRFLLGQKLAFANTAINVCMAWWVSSVVFCGSILAAAWLKRDELVESRIIHLLGIILLIFFAGVVAFGALIWWMYLRNLNKGISEFAERLNPAAKDFFSTEVSTFKWVMFIGTSSFFLILVVWCLLWVGLSNGWWK